MNFYSQAGQDRFVHAVLGGKGTFLDVGCNHPIEKSNTYGLEQQAGWTGLLVDNDLYCCSICKAARSSSVILADATKIAWPDVLANHGLALHFDYVSLDVDAASLAALQNLLRAGISFKVATVEHDAYRFGHGPRNAMRELLVAAGYELVAGDVMDQGQPFEDWWVVAGGPAVPSRFNRHGVNWQEMV